KVAQPFVLFAARGCTTSTQYGNTPDIRTRRYYRRSNRRQSVKTLIAATALIALSIPAYAWTSDPPQTNVTANPSARAGAIAASRSSSSSAASARVSGRVSNRVTVNNTTGTGSGVDPATLAA